MSAATVVNPAAESLMTLLKKEWGLWVSSEKYVEDMDDRMKQLNHTAADMKKKKERNDVMHLEVPHHVSTWLKDVVEINEDVKRIETDDIGIGCCNIKLRYEAGKQSYAILERIKRLEERSKFEWTNQQILLAKVNTKKYVASTSAPVDNTTQSSFESRDLIFKKALKFLKSNNGKTHMMALCGMGGVGKSHMMEKLKKHVEDKTMFDFVVKVVVGQNTDLIALQHALAEQIGGALSETTSNARAGRLKMRFAGMSEDGENKILVILDDLWKELDLQDIGLTSPMPIGFKLLMTSRDANVCSLMGVETRLIFKIGKLNDVEAKTLFFGIVGLSDNDDPDLYKIGEEIIKRCGNLPIALKIIASTLKGNIQDESEWEEALSHLQHHDLKNHYEIVHEVFNISYNYLKRKEDQAIFLLCGLFLDDFDIPVEELLRYGWGLKLFPEVNTTLAKARRRLQTCVNNLTSANLLAKSDRVGCVKMHDLARDFALSNTTKVKQASIVNHDDILDQLTHANKSYTRILLKFNGGISEFPKDFNRENLTFLKLVGEDEQLMFPEDFYENMKKLEVLSYEEMPYPPLLPRSSPCSNHLRTLCLHRCELIPDWYAVGYLVNLEVLSFADSRIKTLPSIIRKLKKLKLLDLTGCIDLCIDDGVLRDLDKLEELYLRVGSEKAIRFSDTNCDELEELSLKLSALEVEFFDNKAKPKNMSFKNLQRFKISIGCLLIDDRDMYSFQTTLKIVTNNNDLLDCKIDELFKKTEKLHLEVKDMKSLKDVSMHPPQDLFSKLRVLVVEKCEDLRILFTVAVASGLRKLERLTVDNCRYLESLIHGDESENDGVIIFQKLKILSLFKLPKLESLCDIDKVVELPQLVELRLEYLSMFTSIYPDTEMQPVFNKQMQPVFNKQVVIPKLNTLRIGNMQNLKQIWPFEITSGEEVQISMVRVVEVTLCHSLVNLFPCNPMPLLRNLKRLQVKDCDSIEVLFNIDLGRAGENEEVSSSLRSIHVTNAMNLTEVWRIKHARNSEVRGFQAVENIHIRRCKRFRHAFTPSTAKFDMRAPLDIDIQDSSDSLFNKALKSLHPNNEATKIALCGLGSVGKTRMMNRLVDEFEGAGTFYLVVKLVIGREANPIILQQATAEYISETLSETNKEARANSLYKRFMQISQEGKNKILVILDDLWKVLDLKDIGLPNPLPNGIKLLITSRDAIVCNQMGVEKSLIFRIGVLDDDEAKTLFFENVGVLKDDNPDLYKIGEEIITKCGNFPISLKTIASVLKVNIKDTSKWEEALSRLQNHELEDINDVLKIAFEMSYNLKTDGEKAILFLCSFFPKDIDIPVEELTRYAWGLKLFPKVYTSLAQERQRIKASVDVLTDTNLLTKSCVGCFKMQQQVNDFVLSKFAKVRQACIDHGNMPEDEKESYERMYLNCMRMSEFHVDFNYPNLKLLKLMGELVKFPQDFYDRMEHLEVVAYEKMVDPLIPSYSTNLQTLCLVSCSLTNDISFLGNLINLEILSFAHCGIQKLPSTIGKLRKLKLLDVTGCVDICIEDGVFKNLVNLEELYMRADFKSFVRFTEANYEELEILVRKLSALEVEFYPNKLHLKDGSFEKAEKFRISIGCQLPNYNKIYSFENTLKLVTNCGELVESKINELFEKTEILCLQVKDMKILEDVSMHYSFCNLIHLEVSDCTDLTFLFTAQVASGLRKLERLKVSSCPILESLIHGESEDRVNVTTFPKLQHILLRELPSLMNLCDTDNRVELLQLETLFIEGLPNFTTIYPDDAMQPYAFFNKQVQIPKLEILSIKSMEKLMQIWPCEITANGSEEEVNNISMLRKIYVTRCDSLVNLFPCNPLPLLNHLEYLQVKNCYSIQVLFNIDLRGAGNINEFTSSLTSIYVERLANLRGIWNIEGGNNSGLPIRCFQDVANIILRNCKRFRDPFFPNTIGFDMRACVEIYDR